MSAFGSFWTGTLSPYERCCLASFARAGHDITLYSYDDIEALPAGIKQGDAAEIVDPSYLGRFITGKKINVAHFSDYFRYNMFLKTALCWVDADVYVLRPFEVDADRHFFVLENGHNICNAILRIETTSTELREIIRRTESILDRDVPWAATQNVIARTFRKRWRDLGSSLNDPSVFMPIHFDEYYKLLLPEFKDECDEKCGRAKTIHLYNNIIDRIGMYKRLLPPEGSYLHELFSSAGSNSEFCGVYPVAVVRSLVEGWRMRFSGECLDAKAIVKQVVPSLARTLEAKRWKYW